MIITKNTYGVTSVFRSKNFDINKIGTPSGSSLERKPLTDKEFIDRIIKKPLFPVPKKEREPRTMSPRTKSKIRRKVIAMARIHKHLSFVTLTFLNKVEEQSAVKILGVFLDNVTKRSKDFQYLWVAEKQTDNEIFKDNIHFHLITNKYWKIDKWWPYWIDLQKRRGVLPRQESYNPSSAFDVKSITGANVKAIANYLTHYVTKNEASFMCQVWNCSKKVSRLYTSLYEDSSFLKKLDQLEKHKLLGGERKIYDQEYCSVHTIPLNRNTLKLYSKLDEKNKEVWNDK
jgi:hypothetical protein